MCRFLGQLPIYSDSAVSVTITEIPDYPPGPAHLPIGRRLPWVEDPAVDQEIGVASKFGDG